MKPLECLNNDGCKWNFEKPSSELHQCTHRYSNTTSQNIIDRCPIFTNKLDCISYNFTSLPCVWNECKSDFGGTTEPCKTKEYSHCLLSKGNEYGECIPANYEALPKIYPSTKENVCTHQPQFSKLKIVREICKNETTEGTCDNHQYC